MMRGLSGIRGNERTSFTRMKRWLPRLPRQPTLPRSHQDACPYRLSWLSSLHRSSSNRQLTQTAPFHFILWDSGTRHCATSRVWRVHDVIGATLAQHTESPLTTLLTAMACPVCPRNDLRYYLQKVQSILITPITSLFHCTLALTANPHAPPPQNVHYTTPSTLLAATPDAFSRSSYHSLISFALIIIFH